MIDMAHEHSVEPEIVDIYHPEDNTLDMSWTVKLNAVLYDITGMQVDMYIRTKDLAHTELYHYSSAGTSPAMTISTTTMNVTSVDTFAGLVDDYEYYINLTDGSEVYTMRKGLFIVEAK